MILSTGVEIKGKEAVVVGRSNIVGKPTSILLLQRHATVTICHSRTRDLGEVTRRADILVASVGSPRIIQGSMALLCVRYFSKINFLKTRGRV